MILPTNLLVGKSSTGHFGTWVRPGGTARYQAMEFIPWLAEFVSLTLLEGCPGGTA